MRSFHSAFGYFHRPQPCVRCGNRPANCCFIVLSLTLGSVLSLMDRSVLGQVSRGLFYRSLKLSFHTSLFFWIFHSITSLWLGLHKLSSLALCLGFCFLCGNLENRLVCLLFLEIRGLLCLFSSVLDLLFHIFCSICYSTVLRGGEVQSLFLHHGQT